MKGTRSVVKFLYRAVLSITRNFLKSTLSITSCLRYLRHYGSSCHWYFHFHLYFRKGKVVNLMQPSQASLAVRFLEARNRKGLRAVHRWPSLMRVEKALWDSCWLVCLVSRPIIVSGAIIAQIAQIAANIPERPFCNPVIRGTAQVYQFVRWPKFGKVPENLLKKTTTLWISGYSISPGRVSGLMPPNHRNLCKARIWIPDPA